MIDTPQWPAITNATDDAQEFVERRKPPHSIYYDFFTDDPWEFPPLVYPRPLVDKALLNRDDGKETSDD